MSFAAAPEADAEAAGSRASLDSPRSDVPPLGGAGSAALAGLVAFAVLVRCVRWWQTSLLFNDGPTFLWIAQEMAAARWREALAHAYHPLYPFLTLLAHFVIPDWEQAAVAVSVVAGAAAVLLLFVFLWSASGRREAWFGALLLAVHPRAIGFADVQSDALYLALFLAAVVALWSGLRRGSAAAAGWAGVLAGLAYLTRPEGLEVAVVAGMAAALAAARGRWGSAARAVAWMAAFTGGLLLVALPYVTVMRVETGTWRVTGKKPVTGLLDLTAPGARAQAPASAVPDPPQAMAPAPAALASPETPPVPRIPAASDSLALPALPASAIARLVEAASSGLRPWLFALIVLGAVARRGRGEGAGELVVLFVVVDAAVALLQFRFAGYLDMRHVLPPLVLTFGYVAAGIDALAGALTWVGRRVSVRGGAGAAPTGRALPPAWLTALLVGVALSAGVGQALRPEKESARAARAAADWLGANATGEGAVAAPKTRLGYYAHRRAVSLHGAPRTGVAGWLGAQGVRWVILDDDDFRHFPALREVPLTVLHCVEEGRRWAAVYTIFAEGEAPAAGEESGCAPAARRALALVPEPRAAVEVR